MGDPDGIDSLEKRILELQQTGEAEELSQLQLKREDDKVESPQPQTSIPERSFQ